MRFAPSARFDTVNFASQNSDSMGLNFRSRGSCDKSSKLPSPSFVIFSKNFVRSHSSNFLVAAAAVVKEFCQHYCGASLAAFNVVGTPLPQHWRGGAMLCNANNAATLLRCHIVCEESIVLIKSLNFILFIMYTKNTIRKCNIH